MFKVRTTEVFTKWLAGLRDHRAKARILARIDRLEMGHFGDVKPVGDGINEMRMFFGPGYRIYYVQRGVEVVILLCGGNKSSQSKDIEKAKTLVNQLEQ